LYNTAVKRAPFGYPENQDSSVIKNLLFVSVMFMINDVIKKNGNSTGSTALDINAKPSCPAAMKMSIVK
jgi:hypothetical protein